MTAQNPTRTPEPVEFFFDPGCPYTWRTSRWLRAVEAAGAAAVTWRLMSLGVLNEGKDLPPFVNRLLQQSQRVLRVLAAAEEQGGSDAVGRLYDAVGERHHDREEFFSDEVVTSAVAAAELPKSLLAALNDHEWDGKVLRSHNEAQQAVGEDTGSPVLRIAGRAFFGPVVVPIPPADQALSLFEAVRLLAEIDAFSELKTSRNPI